MKILAIDTSTEACSAALHVAGNRTSIFEIAPQKHSQLILPMCEKLLADAQLSTNQLDAVAFGRGPGSFTGLRIAAGVTQGIAFGADLPVISVSTLAALAQKHCSQHPDATILSAMDARMQEVYWALYNPNSQGFCDLLGEENIGRPESIQIVIDNELVAVGTGWQAYDDALQQQFAQHKLKTVHADELPSAEQIVDLAVFKYQQNDLLDPAQAIPVYLRNNVAKKSAQQNATLRN